MEAGNENGWRLTNSCLVIYGPVITADRTKTIRCEDPPDDQKNRKAQVQSWRKKKKTEDRVSHSCWFMAYNYRHNHNCHSTPHSLIGVHVLTTPSERFFCLVFCFVHFLALVWWVMILLHPVTPEKEMSRQKEKIGLWVDRLIHW